MRWTGISGVAAVCCAAALAITLNVNAHRQINAKTALSDTASKQEIYSTGAASTKTIVPKNRPLKVMAVGGSSAQGYDDPKLDGYLARALRQVSTRLKISISFINKAKSGNTCTMFAPQYDPSIHSVHPDIVILSWGVLNEISKKVPKTMFQRVIQTEVSQAIKEGAEVWIVTPPATPSTYVGHDVEIEPEYVDLEKAAAHAINSIHVHVFDLLHDMKSYFKEHHLSYKPYESNNWHMNHAGHVLAGQILANDIIKNAHLVGLSS